MTEELAELADFCVSPETESGYRWWRAEAWSGEDLPPLLTESTREAHMLGLLEEAANASPGYSLM